jgi:hypothetical protein
VVKPHLLPYDVTVKSDNKESKLSKYILGTIVGVFALRTLKLAYQRSRLHGMFESITGGDPRTIKLTQSFIDSLPKTSLDFRGRPTEPLNLIIVGEANQIERAFHRARWHEAVPINASNWARAFWTGLRDRSYPTGPMTPYYINTTPQALSFQKETERRSFRQRHHVRFWRTKFQLADGTKLWLGMASFDVSLRLVNGLRFPYHRIDPDLDRERDYLASEVIAEGGKELGRFDLASKLKGRNDHGDRYATDGQVVVIDLREVPDED